MRLVLTGLFFAAGLLFLFMGVSFLLDPVASGTDFGLTPDSAHGLATIRADMTAFFVVGSVCMMIGAWRRNGDLLLVPAGLFGVALLGRFVGLAVDGPWDQYWQPMVVEGAMVILLLIASRVLPHRVG
jgi:hypothetical protein